MWRCASPLRNHPRVVCRFPNNRFPIAFLQPSPGERGVSLHLGSIAQLSPFPGVTSLISFFLDHLFYALVRLGKSIISRFPLPWSLSRGLEGLISQLDFNYPFEDDDAEPRAAAWAAGLSPPVSRPAVPPCRTQHLPKTD